MKIKLIKSFEKEKGWHFSITLSGTTEQEKKFFADIVDSFFPGSESVQMPVSTIVSKKGSMGTIIFTPADYERLGKNNSYFFPKEYNEEVMRKIKEKRGISG